MTEDFAGWGILELMGHKVVAGKISKSEMLGAPLVRVDVPKTTEFPEFTQLFGTAAIYGVTMVSEEVARMVAEQNKVNPVSVYCPELVTREQHDKVMTELREGYNKRLQELRQLLPANPAAQAEPGYTENDHDDEDKWDEEEARF